MAKFNGLTRPDAYYNVNVEDSIYRIEVSSNMGFCSMVPYAYIYHKNQPNVAKYTIHGSYVFSQNRSATGRNIGEITSIIYFSNSLSLSLSKAIRRASDCNYFPEN